MNTGYFDEDDVCYSLAVCVKRFRMIFIQIAYRIEGKINIEFDEGSM